MSAHTCMPCVSLASDGAWCAKLKRNVNGKGCMHFEPRTAAHVVHHILETHAGAVVAAMNAESE